VQNLTANRSPDPAVKVIRSQVDRDAMDALRNMYDAIDEFFEDRVRIVLVAIIAVLAAIAITQMTTHPTQELTPNERHSLELLAAFDVEQLP
jgi:CHASE3 domain sensor protein